MHIDSFSLTPSIGGRKLCGRYELSEGAQMIPGTRASLMEQLELVRDRQVMMSSAWWEKLHVLRFQAALC
jgi:hypothetical protein